MEVRFTNHASEKFEQLRNYGFRISRDQVVDAVESADKKETRGPQVVSSKVIDDEFALRVVHEERKGIILVITFYPVKRKKHGL